MKLTILQPVRHDRKRYAAGEQVDLPKAAAEMLVACGAAEPITKAEAEAKAKAEAEASGQGGAA